MVVSFMSMGMTLEEVIRASQNLESNPARDRHVAVVRYIEGSTAKNFGSALVSVLDNGTGVRNNIPTEKIELYEAISAEKVHRLYADWLRAHKEGNPEDIFSSWQSRDFDNAKYGGAIMQTYWIPGDKTAKCDILSCSGLAEKVDEAVMLVTGIKHDIITPNNAKRVATFSNNKAFYDLAFDVGIRL